MGYDQKHCSWHCSCQTYFCCFLLAPANICPWSLVSFFQTSLKNSEFKTTYNTFLDCFVHFSDNLSRNSCIQFKLAVWRVTHGEPNIGEVSPRNRFIARHSFNMLLSEPLPRGRPHMNAGIPWHFEPDFCCSWRAIVVWSNIKHKQRWWINIMIFCIFINLTQVCMLFNIHFQKWSKQRPL